MADGTRSSPCGACKFLRRKCTQDCIFAPYFCSDQGPARFAAIHKVFGASNVSKILLHLPIHDRWEAVVTIAYEAQARIHNPVYGCVAHIFALQQQVAYLQAQVMQTKAQLANSLVDNPSLENNQWQFPIKSFPGIQTTLPSASQSNTNNNNNTIITTNNDCNNYGNPISPQSSIESTHHQQGSYYYNDDTNFMSSIVMAMHDIAGVIQPKSEGIIGKKRFHYDDDMSELHELAYRMMRN